MRDLIQEELDEVYGAGSRGRKGRARRNGSNSGRRSRNGSNSGRRTRRSAVRRRNRGSNSGRRGSST